MGLNMANSHRFVKRILSLGPVVVQFIRVESIYE